MDPVNEKAPLPGRTEYDEPPTSILAIASLISGILGWTFLPLVGSIFAVIMGHIAKREIRDSAGKVSGDGMATAGLVLGYTAIGLAMMILCFVLALVGLVFGIIFTQNSSLLPGLLLV